MEKQTILQEALGQISEGNAAFRKKLEALVQDNMPTFVEDVKLAKQKLSEVVLDLDVTTKQKIEATVVEFQNIDQVAMFILYREKFMKSIETAVAKPVSINELFDWLDFSLTRDELKKAIEYSKKLFSDLGNKDKATI